MSRSPDWILKAWDKNAGAGVGKLGCAWTNANGTLTLQLDPFTVLQQVPSVTFILFPADKGPKAPTTPPEALLEAHSIGFPPPEAVVKSPPAKKRASTMASLPGKRHRPK